MRFIRAATASELPAPLRGAAWELRLTLRNGTKDRNGAKGMRSGSAERLVLRNDEAVALVSRGARSDARPDFAIALAAEVCPPCSATGAESTDGGRNATAEGRAAGGTSGAVVLVATGRLWAGSVPREALALAADLTAAGWRTALDRLREARPDLDEEIEVCAGMDLNKPVDGSEGGCRAELVAQLAAALARRASVLIVERGALTALECSSPQDPLLALLKRERLVMVWYEQAQVSADFTPQFGERTLLVCAGTAVEAGVDLSAPDSGERIETLLAGPLGKTGKARASVGVEVDDALFDQE